MVGKPHEIIIHGGEEFVFEAFSSENSAASRKKAKRDLYAIEYRDWRIKTLIQLRKLYKNGYFKNLQAAIDFGVEREIYANTSLQWYLQMDDDEFVSQHFKRGVPPELTAKQEEELIKLIEWCNLVSTPLCGDELCYIAALVRDCTLAAFYHLTDDTSPEVKPLSNGWLDNFYGRHPDIARVVQ